LAGANPEQAQAFGNLYLSTLVSGGQVNLAQAPILLATAVAILASVCQIAWLLLKKKTIDKMLWVSLVIVVVFGGATIYFQNSLFMRIKPTILYWCFALAFLISKLFLKRNLIQTMLSQQLELPEPAWNKLNVAWGLFFVVMGVINLIVAFNFSENFWVNFKLFGFMGLMLVFVIAQSVFLSRYMKVPNE